MHFLRCIFFYRDWSPFHRLYKQIRSLGYIYFKCATYLGTRLHATNLWIVTQDIGNEVSIVVSGNQFPIFCNDNLHSDKYSRLSYRWQTVDRATFYSMKSVIEYRIPFWVWSRKWILAEAKWHKLNCVFECMFWTVHQQFYILYQRTLFSSMYCILNM